MSTASGKPFDSFDLLPHAHETRDRTALEQNKSKEGAADVSRAPLPPVDIAAPVDAQHPLDLDGLDKGPSAPPASTQRQPFAEQPAARETTAERPAVPVTEGDPDLARLEASLQWIQREGTVAARMPRAAQLPPVSGLRSVRPEHLRSRDEQFMNRVPLPLAPERLRPPPMRQRRDILRGPVRVLLASVIAAPIAYYFSVGSFSPNTESGRTSGLTSLASRLVASTESAFPKEELPPSEADDYNTMVSSLNKLAVPPTPATVAPIRMEPPTAQSAEVPSPSPAAEQSAPTPRPVRELAPASLKLLMQQGEQFLALGDVITARAVFQRAAEAGDAAAALALGETYDPAVLAGTGARGVAADPEKARMWYERAKEYGSSDAAHRLEELAHR